ncbi:MAG TPA: zinc ABC transporter substrate-binding protein [Thermoanaerobaculia bacterium]|nr:zinc ABC transporter substrate-binding protein [Thermoanaerobaculia bacterium]
MKTLTGFVLLVGVLLAAIGCRAAPEPAADILRVAVTVAPQAEIVRRVGGGRVAVETMIPPGGSDEDLSLTPRKVLALERSRLYVKVGHPAFQVEIQVVDPFLARHPGIQIVDMSRGMAEQSDPHLWVAPADVAIAARNVAAGLEEADPVHAPEYRANLARFLAEIERLDRIIRARLSKPGAERAFLVYHPTWGSFARQYGLRQIAMEVEGKEPGAARLIQTIEEARARGARLVVVPEAVPRESAKVLAEAVRGRIVTADPLSPDWERTLLRLSAALAEGAQHG